MINIWSCLESTVLLFYSLFNFAAFNLRLFKMGKMDDGQDGRLSPYLPDVAMEEPFPDGQGARSLILFCLNRLIAAWGLRPHKRRVGGAGREVVRPSACSQPSTTFTVEESAIDQCCRQFAQQSALQTCNRWCPHSISE